MVAQIRIELMTPGSSGLRSTTELPGHVVRMSMLLRIHVERGSFLLRPVWRVLALSHGPNVQTLYLCAVLTQAEA